jgi:translation initiation factor IF-1
VPSEDAIAIEGVIVEVLRDGLFRAELANGHRLMAHLARSQRDRATRIVPGEKVVLEMTPFDMSKGRIIG